MDSDKSKKNRRRIGVDHTEEPDAINLDVFVEILNILDEELLNDNSFHELRRTWTPDEPIDQVIAVRHLVMWCCLFNRMELIDSIFESESLQKFDTSAIFEPNEPSGDLYNGFPNASLSSHVGLGIRVQRTKSQNSRYFGWIFIYELKLSGLRNIIGNVIDFGKLLKINKEVYHVSRVTE